MNSRDLATVLGALRVMQQQVAEFGRPWEAMADALTESGARDEPMTMQEIDDLCARLQSESNQEHAATELAIQIGAAYSQVRDALAQLVRRHDDAPGYADKSWFRATLDVAREANRLYVPPRMLMVVNPACPDLPRMCTLTDWCSEHIATLSAEAIIAVRRLVRGECIKVTLPDGAVVRVYRTA